MIITIESNIPIPPPAAGKPLYRFDELAVGQSIAIPITGKMGANGKRPEYSRLRAAATAHGKRYGKTFDVRIMHGDGVVRCWRVA